MISTKLKSDRFQMAQPMAAGICFNPQQDCKMFGKSRKRGVYVQPHKHPVNIITIYTRLFSHLREHSISKVACIR